MKKDVEKWIRKSVRKITQCGLFPPFSLSLIWSNKEYKKDGGVEATIQYYRDKKLAKMTIYPPFVSLWKKGRKEYLFDVLVHEMAHLNTSELQEMAMDSKRSSEEIEEATERLAGVIAKYIKSILKGNKKTPRVTFYDSDTEW